MNEPRKLRALVVDDEPLARATLRKLIATDDEIELAGECANGHEALEAVRQERPDLVFLDVEMPGLGGFEMLESLDPADRPVIVFTTAYDRYAVEAFDMHAVDYLLKPFDDERFERALQRAKERVRRDAVVGVGRELANLLESVRRSDGDLSAAATDGGTQPDAGTEVLQRITIHREGSMELIEVATVDWVEAADQYVRLHTTDGEHLMRESMNHLEGQLDPARFVRVHRSAIVALDRVRRLESQSGGVGRLQLHDGTWVPVSRSRLANLRRRLG